MGLGNHTPSAEFNIYADPEAARAVISSGIPIKMSGLELTSHAAITDAVMDGISALGTRVGAFVNEILHFYRASFRERHGYDGAPIYDACAVAWLADSSMVRSKPMHVAVDTNDGPDLGRTVTDVQGVLGHEPNVDVGMELRSERLWDLLLTSLETYP